MFPCPSCNQVEIDYASGLKDRERAITLNAIDTAGRPNTATMKTAAAHFISKPYGFLSLHGNNGTGKTLALMAITNAIIAAGSEARYITASELLAYMRDTFNNDTHETDYDRIHELARVPVLCIDEMDKLRDTPYSREIQQELINLRYRDANILGTVLAWNGDLNDLPWPAVISRLSEYVVVKNNDSDMRKLLGEIR
jgi:DNA replication protein DnaC